MKKIWWKEDVIYQIYPRSFKDSNGDGIGDLQGIISKLDYLKYLGVDILWLCPIYQSPNDDNGYDISDYYKIHPEYGTMEDFEELLAGLHKRGMKLIMDIVVNHSSDEHVWFEQSKSSKENSYRDYYYWKPGKEGGPPNNWKSFFGGSAWEYDERTKEYYLHLFAKKQPELNWENPKLREEFYKILSFWMEKGIDGFRMDVISLISKRLEFADTKLGALNDVIAQVYSNGPKVHEYIQTMYQKVFSKYDVMTVGEGPGISTEVGLDYVDENRGELSMIFHLNHMYLGHGPFGKFDPVPYDWNDIVDIVLKWDEAMGTSGWISIFLDNHDFPRLVSRFGNDKEYRVESAKLLAMMIFTLRGTACIYQGSELGMSNVHFPNLEDYEDVETHTFYKEFAKRGLSEADFLKRVHEHGRDNARTPMQWDESEHAGFTTGTPWLNVNPNHKEINAGEAQNNEDSIFHFYRKLMAYRKQNKTFVYGEFKVITQESKDLFVYERKDEEGSYIILLNHSDREQKNDLNLADYELDFYNLVNSEKEKLAPWEGRTYKKKATRNL
ncbi:MAG: oligo-1,6-glucosidase [Gammaproteobacteria bacterium]|jgi:oligo-1,6-glucosidase